MTIAGEREDSRAKPAVLASLAHRHRVAEIMDQPGLGAAEHAEALAGLGRINRVSGSAAILWPAIASLAASRRGRTIRVLDLATGGGDVPISLARRARRDGLDLRIEGCDISPVAVALAAQAAGEAGLPVRFFRLDCLNDPLPEGFDVVTCSLFLHHLGADDAVRLLRKMADAAQQVLLINDLLRSRAGYWAAWVGCRLLSRSMVVHHDGPVSVRAAFSLAEAAELSRSAGLAGARLTRRWPWRFLMTWSRPTP